MPDIAIIGLGPLGAVLGRSVKAALPNARVAGFDADRSESRRAAQAGAVDEACSNVAQTVAGAQLIVVATPLPAARDVLRTLGQLAPADSVVTDACMLKTPVLKWAAESLPPSVHFVGGRPLARPASNGAPGELSLQDADYCIIPGAGAPSEAIDAVIGLANAAGAKPFFIEAAEHDSFVIAAELLPRIAAAAAIDAASAAIVWRDVRRFRGEPFNAAVAQAGLDPEELAIALEHAPASLAAWTDRLIGALGGLREMTQSDAGAAETSKALAELAEERSSRLGPPEAESGPAFERQSFSSLLLGDWFANRARLRR